MEISPTINPPLNSLSTDPCSLNDGIYEIKKANLRDTCKALKAEGYHFWLSGRTLLYACKVGCINADIIDSVGLYRLPEPEILRIINIMNDSGFVMLIRNIWELIFVRDNRQIKLELFKQGRIEASFKELVFPRENFDNLTESYLHGFLVGFPRNHDDILTSWFSPSKRERNWRGFKSVFINPYRFILDIKAKLIEYIEILPVGFQNYIYRITGSKRRVVRLSESQFLETIFEDDPYNWIIRRPHLDLITNNGKYKKISEIMNYLSNSNNFDVIKKEIIETPINKSFFSPLNFCNSFWGSGNNYFINCILCSFRKHVIPYENINTSILSANETNIYSLSYYEELEVMSDKEIAGIMKQFPIKIARGSFKSGRHRICAMMGRMLKGDSYIPIYAIYLDSAHKRYREV
jgi:hypothetical protein